MFSHNPSIHCLTNKNKGSILALVRTQVDQWQREGGGRANATTGWAGIAPSNGGEPIYTKGQCARCAPTVH